MDDLDKVPFAELLERAEIEMPLAGSEVRPHYIGDQRAIRTGEGAVVCAGADFGARCNEARGALTTAVVRAMNAFPVLVKAIKDQHEQLLARTDGSQLWDYNHRVYNAIPEADRVEPEPEPTLAATVRVYVDNRDPKKGWHNADFKEMFAALEREEQAHAR